jgi:hypothetical protein
MWKLIVAAGSAEIDYIIDQGKDVHLHDNPLADRRLKRSTLRRALNHLEHC